MNGDRVAIYTEAYALECAARFYAVPPGPVPGVGAFRPATFRQNVVIAHDDKTVTMEWREFLPDGSGGFTQTVKETVARDRYEGADAEE